METKSVCMRVLMFYPASYHFPGNPVHSPIIRGRTTAHSEATGPQRSSLPLPQVYKKEDKRSRRVLSHQSVCRTKNV